MTKIEDLQAEYKRLAKRADQRMRELEKASGKKGYKNVLDWSYAVAQDNLTALFGESVTRFDRKINEKTKLRKALGAVKGFLNSETSTIGKGRAIDGVGEVSGIRAMYDKRAQAMNEYIEKNIGGDFKFTTETFHDFVQNQKYQKLRKKYDGSWVILMRIYNAMKNRKEIEDMIVKEQHRSRKKITDRMIYNRVLRDIEQNGFSAAKDLI